MADTDESNKPFLPSTINSDAIDHSHDLTSGQAWCLYLSHFLSIWNSRAYEYGAILFIQSAYPGNLLASSLNGIAETVCVLVSASALGRWVDSADSRLRPLLLTILINRVTLVACCLLWLLLFTSHHESFRRLVFVVLLMLGMVEKVSRMTNILSMERDWIPTLANATAVSAAHGTTVRYSLTHLNTAMRRIDMACRSLAPLAISALVATVGPSPAAATVGSVSLASMLIEVWSATKVWKQNRRLRTGKAVADAKGGVLELELRDLQQLPQSSSHSNLHRSSTHTRFATLAATVKASWKAHSVGVRYYFSSSVWQPSLCVAVFHGSVLAWSGTLVTWLLNAGFPLEQVTIAKGLGSVFEFGSTLAFPLGVAYFSRNDDGRTITGTPQVAEMRRDRNRSASESEATHNATNSIETEPHADSNIHMAVVRVAKWAICGVLVALLPTIIALFYVDLLVKQSAASEDDGASTASTLGSLTIAIVVFFTFLSISFLGRWTFDLSVTQLTQMLVPATHRSTFGGTEQAIVSCVSMTHWVSAAIWHEQEAFKWMALASFFAIGAATGAYHWWARRWKTSALASAVLR